MTHGEPTGSSWPPPHPSPPEPPARGSGIPGAPPSRAPYVVGAVAVLVVVAVVALAVVLLTGGEEQPENDKAADRPAEATTAAAGPARATCWDGSAAESVEACSAPTGPDGLAWVFPGYADAKCGQAQEGGDPGVVTRVLCIRKLASGVNVQLGYYQWTGVAEAQAFYDGQGLDRTDGPELLTWTGVSGKRAKAATLYAAQPYSVTVTHPASYTLTAEDQAALAPRPAAEVLGVADQ